MITERDIMDDCIFCKIANGDIPTDFLYQDDNFVVFKDIHPDAKFHALIVPKEHILNVTEIKENECKWGKILTIAREIAKTNKLDGGFRLVINNGSDAGQVVDHLHCHILGGEKLGPLNCNIKK